jgi:4-amino-4-deoxy-L-arabinose transferase-like glycosyltransferase
MGALTPDAVSPAVPQAASDRPGRAGWLLAAGIVVVAGSLRFASIEGRSLWFDEAYSFRMARRPLREIVVVAGREDTHPPLYYMALSGWIRAFGTGEAGLRSLGAVASTLTVGGTWWLGRRLGGPMVGAVAAFLAAVAPLQILAAQEARMYPLLGLLTLWSWAMLVLALEKRPGAWIGYVLATTLALYTHYFAFLTLAGQGLFVLAAARRLWRPWAASLLASAVLYMPWLPYLAQTYASGRGSPFFRPPVGAETLTSLLGLWAFGGHAFGFDGYFGGGVASVAAQAAVVVPFVALAAAGAVWLRRHPPALGVVMGYLAVPVALAFAVSLRQNIFYARYFSYVYPAFAVLLAAGMMRVAEVVAPAARRAAVLGLVLVSLGFSAPVLHDLYTDPRLSHFDWRGAAGLLAREAGRDDLILVIPAVGYLPFTYYFKGPQRIVPLNPRELLDIRTGRPPEDPAAEERSRALFRSYAAGHEVAWIIVTGPFPPTAMERLKGLISGFFDVRGAADFGGVRLFRITRRPDWQATP